MPSKVEALVRSFLQTDGDALYLVPGERMFLTKGQTRSVVGREPLSVESFQAVCDELVPGSAPEALAEERYRVPFLVDPASEPVDIRFGLSQGKAALMVARTRKAAGPPSVAAPAPAPVPSPAPLPPPPQAAAPLPAPVAAASPAPAAVPPAPRPAPVPQPPARSRAPEPAAPAAVAYVPEPPGPPAPQAAPEPAAGIDALPFEPDGTLSIKKKGSSPRPLDDVLLRMLELKASDVHMSSDSVPIFRVHGEMEPQTDMPLLRSEEVERLLQPVMPEKNRKEFGERNDTDFAYEIPGVARFRVNVFRDRHGVGAVFRQIPIEILTAQQLNLPDSVIRLGDLTKGLVLVTGPTGSGKSTTLAAIVDHINKNRTDHIITIEDPIEFVHQNRKCLVNQREVGSHTRGFKDALRAALREDPDIVLVGEMRDLETIAIAIETAETGHLVFGTLHTTTATSTVDRIVDQFPADRQQQIRVMLADSLRGVVAQTLCKKVGGGRVAALEILLSSNAVANLIRDGKTFQLPSVLQTSRAQGMVLLNDSLLELVKKGLVDPREAYLKAVDKTGLLGSYRSNNIALPTEGAPAEAAPAAVPTAAGPPGKKG